MSFLRKIYHLASDPGRISVFAWIASHIVCIRVDTSRDALLTDFNILNALHSYTKFIKYEYLYVLIVLRIGRIGFILVLLKLLRFGRLGFILFL